MPLVFVLVFVLAVAVSVAVSVAVVAIAVVVVFAAIVRLSCRVVCTNEGSWPVSAPKYQTQSAYFTAALLLRFGGKPGKLAQPIHNVPDCAWKVIAGFLADRG